MTNKIITFRASSFLGAPGHPASDRHALPTGYQLLWYRMEKILGQGGFGITYLATDTNLNRKVAIKEYMPLNLVVRGKNNSVHCISSDRYKMYQWGLERFIAEARALAKFNHPNIVRVHSVFEHNNTAYMTMEYEQGDHLNDLYHSNKAQSEDWLLKLIMQLLDGLELIHAAGFIHRDIKPANIFIRADDSPVLLDFGSARLSLGSQTHTLTSLVSPGYAPYEQYSSEGTQQGPWSDIYALSATLYVLIAGRGPVDAILRTDACLKRKPDPLIPAVKIGSGKFSPRFLEAIDSALNLLPENRPQSIAEWRPMFPPPTQIGVDITVPTLRTEVGVDVVERMRSRSGEQRRNLSWWLIVSIVGLIAAGITVSVLMDSHQWLAVNPTDKALTNQKQNVLASKTPANEYHEKQEPLEQGTGIDDDKRQPSIEISQTLGKAVFRDRLADGSLGPEMVVIEAGSFRMGDIQQQGPAFETPVHTVHIAKAFAIGRYEVRFEEYDQFARATGRRLPRDRGWGRGNRPVINVSWDDAVAYAKWLSQQTAKHYRLPSEAEWEYAARAGTATAYWWGNDIGHNRAACDGCGSQWDRKQTAPVGSFEPNTYGLYDTAGNVWEWVQDCKIDNYKNVPTDGSAWLLGDCFERVFRGGSWNVPPHKLRSAKRTWDNPGLRYSYVGFRLAQDL